MESIANIQPLIAAQVSGVSENSDIAKSGILGKQSENTTPVEQEVANSYDKEELDGVVSDINKVVQTLQRDLQFSLDEKNGGTILRVLDRETNDTIREIPSAEIRALRERMREVSGIIFKDSV